jgi:hypothetical protein
MSNGACRVSDGARFRGSRSSAAVSLARSSAADGAGRRRWADGAGPASAFRCLSRSIAASEDAAIRGPCGCRCSQGGRRPRAAPPETARQRAGQHRRCVCRRSGVVAELSWHADVICPQCCRKRQKCRVHWLGPPWRLESHSRSRAAISRKNATFRSHRRYMSLRMARRRAPSSSDPPTDPPRLFVPHRILRRQPIPPDRPASVRAWRRCPFRRARRAAVHRGG